MILIASAPDLPSSRRRRMRIGAASAGYSVAMLVSECNLVEHVISAALKGQSTANRDEHASVT